MNFKIGDVFIYFSDFMPTKIIQIYQTSGHLYQTISLNSKDASTCDHFFLEKHCIQIKNPEILNILFGIDRII